MHYYSYDEDKAKIRAAMPTANEEWIVESIIDVRSVGSKQKPFIINEFS